MPELDWNELEVTSYLAVLPEGDDFFTSHTFRVSASDLSLLLTLWQSESVAQFTLTQASATEPLTSFALVVRGGMRYRDEKWGEYLEFRDCILAPRRFYFMDLGDVFDKVHFPRGIDVELKVRPQIQISFLQDDV